MAKSEKSGGGLYKKNGSGYWYYSFSVKGTRYQGCTLTENRTLAKQIKEAKRADALRQESGFVKENNATLRELVQRYLEATKDEKRSHLRDVQIADTMLAHFGGNKRLSEMNGNEILIKGYIEARKKNGGIVVNGKPRAAASRTTINRELAMLKHMYNCGIEWGIAIVNPVKRGAIDHRAEREAVKQVYLSETEAREYIEAAKALPHYYPVAMCALLCGMRSGEIKGLHWNNVDLENGAIYLERTKGGKPRRVYMPNELTKELSELKYKSRVGSVDVFNNSKDGCYKDFRRAHETVMRVTGIEAQRLAQFAGITDATERAAAIKKNRITFHTLRHTFGTHLMAVTGKPNVVKEAMGHSDLKTTQRYCHVIEEQQRAGINALAEAFYYPATTGQIIELRK
ncbi:MAG: site-specific integrase [bacterium]